MQLRAADIRTREVLHWQGLHLLHFSVSSCSQKTRIVLALKAIPWTSHVVELGAHASWQDWYLGINPRGLVPTLVVDGEVHIESNDIIRELDRRYPQPGLTPSGRDEELDTLLEAEDALHLDLRLLSFRFVHGRTGTTKSPEVLAAFKAHDAPRASAHPEKDREVAFYEHLAAEGLSDAACAAAARRFRQAFDDHERRLTEGPYLLGAELSLLDVAWFVYAFRLSLAGYPLARLHPRVSEWFEALCRCSTFTDEVAMGAELQERIAGVRAAQVRDGVTLERIAGL